MKLLTQITNTVVGDHSVKSTGATPESEQRFSLLELLPPNNSLRLLSNEELLAYLPVTILPRTIDDTEAANVAATVLNQVIREEILRRLQQERLTISPQN